MGSPGAFFLGSLICNRQAEAEILHPPELFTDGGALHQ